MRKIVLVLALSTLLVLGTYTVQAQQSDAIHTITPTKDITAKSGVYVPKDLTDAHQEFDKMLSPAYINEIKTGSEGDLWRYHMSLGMWMRNYWGLWAGSRLARYFRTVGILHPDDMSETILLSYWRRLHAQPFDLLKQARYYQKYYQEAAEPKRLVCPIDGSKIVYKGNMGADDKGGVNHIVHFGVCQKCKRLWAYQYNKGWYLPDATLSQRWQAPR